MTIFVSQCRDTPVALKTMIATPVDRWDSARRLVEAADGTLLHICVTDGEDDVVMIAEARSAEAYGPVLLAAASTGWIEGLTTVPAMTTAEATRAAETAGEVGAGFRPATDRTEP